jgi:predicted Zn-dependent protease
VAAVRADLVEGGVLRGALSNRESAAAVGLGASGGCARADGFARQPIVRMTNVSLEPGTMPTLADLIADTDEGLYLETNRSWSIDDRRLQFQFATELCREIRGGELGRLYRNGSYAGVTPRFWGSLDAICGPDEWRLWGLTNCGKGEPGQVMVVSHGAAPGALSRRAGRGRRDRSRAARAGRARAGLRRRRGAGHRRARALAALALRGLAPHAGHGGRRPHGLAAVRRPGPHRLGGDQRDDRRGAARRRRARPGRGARRGRAPPASPATTRGLPGPRPAPSHDGFDPLTAQLDPGAAGEALSVAFERCAAAGLQAFGVWTAGAVDTAIASSTGVRALDSVTDAVHEGHRPPRERTVGLGGRHRDLDRRARSPTRSATRAAAKVTREEPVELAPGEYPVVLESDAVGSLLEFLGGLAFDGLAHTEGRGRARRAPRASGSRRRAST